MHMHAPQISCCFSGYRPGKLPWGNDENDPRCRALKARLRDVMEVAYDEGYRHGLIGACDEQTLLQENYSPHCMQRRNRYMVDHAGLLIAVFDGQSGGTRGTVQYAMSRGLQIVDIPPVMD